MQLESKARLRTPLRRLWSLQKPSDEDACQLLHGLAPKYEKHLNVPSLHQALLETDEIESRHLNAKTC